jgi:hypothetical protein
MEVIAIAAMPIFQNLNCLLIKDAYNVLRFKTA